MINFPNQIKAEHRLKKPRGLGLLPESGSELQCDHAVVVTFFLKAPVVPSQMKLHHVDQKLRALLRIRSDPNRHSNPFTPKVIF
jgi:hypothetical protein